MIRGCGTRQAGGIYVEVATSPYGMPLEHFLIDPPLIIRPGEIGLSPIGVHGVVWHGTYHILDWVGSDSYPKVADFIDEAHMGGISRRCEGSGIDYSMITPDTRLVLVHARAAITNWQGFMRSISQDANAWACPKYRCPCGVCAEVVSRHAQQFEACKSIGMPGEVIEVSHEIAAQLAHPSGCTGLHWHDFEPRDVVADRDGPGLRHCAHGDYYVSTRPMFGDKPIEPKYEIAIFARLPIRGLAVVRDPSNPARHAAQVEKANSALVSVELVDE